MSMAARIFEIFVGLVLLITGALIIYAIRGFDWQQGHDIWDGGFLLLAEAYSIIGSLFILLGLRYVLGRQSFIERRISRSLRDFAFVLFFLSLAILAAFIFSLR
jgi:hypothetical protein